MKRLLPRTPAPLVPAAAWTMVLPAVLLLVGSACAAEPIDFNRDIRPLLADRCFFCHGPDPEHREAELRLDVEDDAKQYAIVEEAPEESVLIERITSDDADLRMPPAESGKSLSAEEIALIRRWIAEGAVYDPYWAYQPPVRHAIPEVAQRDWPANWIDHFLLARLEKEGLQPAAEADRITLIRRLSFDLTGLPPTPAEVEAFLADDHPRAYERVVDRLLASERYGERMAVYWLDLVRFADTVGYHGDQDHVITPYRDYVIDALNRNVPFDQFTREQLAGDLVADSGIDQKIASGYNRLLQTSHEGGVQPKEYLAIYAADRVRNVSAVWMGATVGCAQCHDHKFDPYTAKDFYSLAAFFADVDEARHFTRGGDRIPTSRAPEIKVLARHEREQLAALEAQLEKLQAARAADKAEAAAKEADDNESRPDEKPAVEATADVQESDAQESDAEPSEPHPLDGQIERLEAQIKAIRDGARMTMVTESIEPRPMRILPRGDWLSDDGPLVQPAVPEFLGGLESERRLTRLDLANWLTDPVAGSGGLTARVMANRFWYLLFGGGIARSLDDFGAQGEPPVHPELLDNLAVEFYESQWDVKHLLKLIVMSRAYRQESTVSAELAERDPLNRLYARQSRWRLPAEMIRDNALMISGLLVLDYGGPSVKPYQPAGYYRHLNFPTRRYTADLDRRQWRRGVYMHWQRQFLHPMLKAFDAPSREECTAERPRSNTPLAALVLLNDPTFVEAARVLAARILSESAEADDSARIDFALQLAVNRAADDVEREILTTLLREQRRAYHDAPEAAGQIATAGAAPPAEQLDPAEVAAWTAVARAVLNMNETITRN